MPDITMCNNKKCKKKEKCYRYMAKPDEFQSYSDFEGSCTRENGYRMLMKIKRGR